MFSIFCNKKASSFLLGAPCLLHCCTVGGYGVASEILNLGVVGANVVGLVLSLLVGA